MRRRTPSLAAAAFLALAAPAAMAATSLPPPDEATALRSAVADYRIVPQDVVDIQVDQVDALTKTFTVDTGGKLLLPLVGQVQASGRTTAQLSEDIATALKAHYMKNPQVVVALKEAQGQKVTIDGAVIQPGVYALTGPTTLLQAVALAKGPDPKLANTRRVGLFRTVGGQRRSAFYDLDAIRTGKLEDPVIYGSDIVVVDTSGSKSFMQNFQGGFGLLGMLIRPW